MVEPLFLSLSESSIAKSKLGDYVKLTGTEAHHAVAVRRVRNGEVIRIGNGAGVVLRCQVESADKDELAAKVIEVLPVEASTLKITLVQALAKGDRDELAIQAATELGVSQVIPWQAERSISLWNKEKAAKQQLRWQSICTEAAKQSLRSTIPVVQPLATTAELVSQLSDFEMVLVLDPEAKQSMFELAIHPGIELALIVGPEGGISGTELEIFQDAGFGALRLGSSVLRTSTAGPAAIAALQSRWGDWGPRGEESKLNLSSEEKFE